jgi:hypothetical protein
MDSSEVDTNCYTFTLHIKIVTKFLGDAPQLPRFSQAPRRAEYLRVVNRASSDYAVSVTMSRDATILVEDSSCQLSLDSLLQAVHRHAWLATHYISARRQYGLLHGTSRHQRIGTRLTDSSTGVLSDG